jgi:endoglycosylceramidase
MMTVKTRSGARWLAALMAIAVLAAACSSSGSQAGENSTTTVPATPVGGTLRPLHALRGADARVVDDQGRQVLLRGVNLNGFGSYYEANAAYPATIPVTDGDWAAMAQQGFDVVRLLISWSSVEPTKGTIDQAYLDRIHTAVDAAAAHGLYAVLDMHQDAWGQAVATPAGATCPSGSKPGIGWDGAPAWATITDGAETCAVAGIRELAPAVQHAFENFYNNTDGIQDDFVKTWAAVASEFAADPAVAGYDLFNEPNWGLDSHTGGARLGAVSQKVIAAIRTAEQAISRGMSHIVFFEPVVIYPNDGTTLPDENIADPNVVFAPHNYAESIDPGTIEQKFTTVAATARAYGTTFWIGEYGWFDATAENAAKAVRYAAAEDQYRVGGTWWQWKQACGDPHSVGEAGGTPADQIIEYTRNSCPGDVDQGVIAEWKPAMTRAYPRSAPGLLTNLASNPTSGAFTVSGTVSGTAASATLDLWVPDRGHGPPTITGSGLGTVDVQGVPGGFRALIPVTGDYTAAIAS